MDFAKLREQNKKMLEEQAKARAEGALDARPEQGNNFNKPNVFKGTFQKREFSSISGILMALQHEDLTKWERNFVNSVHRWVTGSPDRERPVSEKQLAVIQKLMRNYNLDLEPSKVPTRDNRFPDGVYKAPGDNYNSAPARHFDSFDDMDDDIPF